MRDPAGQAGETGDDQPRHAAYRHRAQEVIDVGGALSHGVIIARELGIPCVIGTVDGTRQIPQGARVRVDGTTGTVEMTSDS